MTRRRKAAEFLDCETLRYACFTGLMADEIVTGGTGAQMPCQ